MLPVRRARAPVVPVALEGAFDIWPATRRFPRLRGRLMVMAGPVIPSEELLAVPPAQALDRLRREIETMRPKLRDELRGRTSGRYPAPGPADAPYWEREPASDG